MDTAIGKVRLLPPGTPGIPPSVRYEVVEGEGGYLDRECCRAFLARGLIPEEFDTGELDDMWTGYWCTRPVGHDPDEIHVCHLRNVDTGEPIVLIVWGGE